MSDEAEMSVSQNPVADTAEHSTEKGESLWEKVLAEHREHSAAAKARDVYQLFVVGDRMDGKEKVFKWLCPQDDMQEEEEEEKACPAGLSFSYGEWKEKAVGEDEESTVRILQTLVERPFFQYLLPAYFLSGALVQRHLESSFFAITVDLSTPSTAIDVLNKWYSILEQTVKDSAGDDLAFPKRLQEKMEAQCDAFHTDPRAQIVKKQEVDDGLEMISPRADTGRASTVYRKMGIFSRGNLGVPLIVICTKVKALDIIASQQSKFPKEKEHFLNYIQATLRKWALERGAALIYTDGERNTSETLREYLLYRTANIPMSSMLDGRRQVSRRVPSATTGHNDLFVPAFADSLGQVAKLQVGKYADAQWGQVVPAAKEAAAADGDVDVPPTFNAWLANEKKKAKEGGLLGAGTSVPREHYSKGLEDLRKRSPPSKSSKGNTLEATAESFFSNIILTYKKQGDGKSAKSSRTSRTAAGTAAASAAPAAPDKN